jgi:hypothetical protein
MRRWVAGAAVPLMLLVGCSSTSSSTSSPAAPPSTSASATASCVDKSNFDSAIQSAQDHVSSAVTSAASLNFGTAKDELQQAGQDLQNAADLVGEASPDIKNELQSASDRVNQAITDLQNNNATAAGADLQAAGAALTQATANGKNIFC